MNIKLILLGLFIMFGSVIGALWVSNFWLIGYFAINLACTVWSIIGVCTGIFVIVEFGGSNK